jgi:ribonuclease PH
LTDSLAAVSAGIVNGIPALDLNYEEDSSAEVDMNFVMTGSGKYVEVQGTAEEAPFSKEEMATMASLAEAGIQQLTAIQKEALEG